MPTYFKEKGVAYNFEHRNEKSSPDAYRDYVPHTVDVVKNSLLYDIVGTYTLEGCPSWHHQCVKNVDDTRLIVTGLTNTNGIDVIEAVERTDKTFAMGLQFHPEASIVKHLEGAENADDFMDTDTALLTFKRLVSKAAGEAALEEAA